MFLFFSRYSFHSLICAYYIPVTCIVNVIFCIYVTPLPDNPTDPALPLPPPPRFYILFYPSSFICLSRNDITHFKEKPLHVQCKTVRSWRGRIECFTFSKIYEQFL